MQIFLYPLDSLDELEAVLHQGCNLANLFDATPQRGQQAVLAQVDGLEALGVVQYVQDYFSLTNYALLFEIDEADPCESTRR